MVANSSLRESKGRGRITEREKREREKSLKERKEREMWESQEQMREKINKIIFLFLQLSYNAILYVELHCNTIANFFAMVYIYNSRY